VFEGPSRSYHGEGNRQQSGPEQEASGREVSKQVESVKHLLWHGNVEEALERVGSLLMNLDLIRKHAPAAEKLSGGVAEFLTYIRNNENPFRTTASGTGKGRRSAQRSWSPQSTKW